MTKKLQSILEAEGLSLLFDKFYSQGITDSVLADLTDSHLKDLGIDKLGERMRLLRAFGESSGSVEPPRPMENMNASSWVNTPSVEEQVQIIAAEPYLSLPPYEALKQFLKDCGGYDMTLADNVIMFPAELRFTRDPNAQGQVMVLVVRISQLMLQFYRDQVTVVDSDTNETLQKLGVQHLSELACAVRDSAGKQRAASNLVQQDFIRFVWGQSQCLVKSDIKGAAANEPLIKSMGDFQSHPRGQEVFKAFVQLCNQMEQGPLPSGWQTAGSIFEGLCGGIGDLGKTLGGFRGF